MKLIDLFEQPKDLAQSNELDHNASKMKLPNVYKEKDVGGKSKVTAQTTIIKDEKSGKIYSRKTIHQKVV